MPDPKIHFLNVKNGDCAILERFSGRVTVMDICCGNIKTDVLAKAKREEERIEKPKGNYGMSMCPTNL